MSGSTRCYRSHLYRTPFPDAAPKEEAGSKSRVCWVAANHQYITRQFKWTVCSSRRTNLTTPVTVQAHEEKGWSRGHLMSYWHTSPLSQFEKYSHWSSRDRRISVMRGGRWGRTHLQSNMLSPTCERFTTQVLVAAFWYVGLVRLAWLSLYVLGMAYPST